MTINTRAVTSHFTLRIVRALQGGPLRFNQIDRATHAPNPVILSKHLKKMQRDGLIERHIIKLGPPAHVAYSLTPLGAGLAKPAAELLAWIDSNVAEIQACREYQHALVARADQSQAPA